MNLELIIWEDSSLSGEGWEMIDDLDDDLKIVRVKSVGYVLRETAEAVELVPNIGGANEVDQVCQGIRIPKRCIVRRVALREE